MESKTNQNQREFTRIPIHVMVEVRSEGTAFKTDKTQDLSMKGIFLKSDQVLPLKALCEVSLLLGEEKNRIRIEIKGKVTRSNDAGMGIEFTEIDLDGYDSLQNLIMHNSHSAHDIVEEEIHSHLGLKKKV